MSEELMRVAVMNEVGKLDIEERPIPQYGEDDALIRVSYVGVCGSDMALFRNGFIGDKNVTEPMVLGHEASGTVVAVGKNVWNLKPGDRVAMEPGVPCGHCSFCREGKYNLCPDVYFWASLPVVEGALQEYVCHPANMCFTLPSTVSLVEGALIEPLSVAFHAVRQSGIQIGETAVVFGAGCVGLLTMLTLKAAGAASVTVVDVVDNRLNLAATLGADTFNAAQAQPLDQYMQQKYPEGPAYVFDAAGNANTMDSSIRIVRRGGTITFIGYTKDGRANLNVNLLIDKELTIHSAFRYRGVYPKAIAEVASGAIPVAKVVSSVFSLKDAQTGLDYAIDRKAEVTKCVIRVAAEEV